MHFPFVSSGDMLAHPNLTLLGLTLRCEVNARPGCSLPVDCLASRWLARPRATTSPLAVILWPPRFALPLFLLVYIYPLILTSTSLHACRPARYPYVPLIYPCGIQIPHIHAIGIPADIDAHQHAPTSTYRKPDTTVRILRQCTIHLNCDLWFSSTALHAPL